MSGPPCGMRCARRGDGPWTHSVNSSLLQVRRTVGLYFPICTPVCLASWSITSRAGLVPLAQHILTLS